MPEIEKIKAWQKKKPSYMRDVRATLKTGVHTKI